MHRKSWFLVAAAVAVFALTGTAAATGGSHSTIKWTPQARAIANQVSFGMEQPIGGCNGLNAEETLAWAAYTCGTPIIRGNYIVDNNRVYHYDAALSVVSTLTTLTIHIKPGAQWAVEGGGVHDMVAQDYATTYQVIMNPNNAIASTTGYSNIKQNAGVADCPGVSCSMPGGPNGKVIIFKWQREFRDWKDLFGFILPDFAIPSAFQLQANGGQLFNELWRDCVCVQTIGGDGHLVDGSPVSNGPFFVHTYSDNNGLTDTPNHRWYGHDSTLDQVNFIRANSGGAEESALASGLIDAAFPAPNAAYVVQKNDPSHFTYQPKPGFVQEHLDFNEANPLLAHGWMRDAIGLGINRPALIQSVYVAPGIIGPGVMSQLNSGEYVLGKYAVAPYDYFKTWNFNQTRALSLLSAHCTGGPTSPSPSNNKIWQCPDGPASFNLLYNGAPLRGTSATIYQSELKQIGISMTPNPDSTIFSVILPHARTTSCVDRTTSPDTPQSCGAPTYDVAEYAWGGGVDPSGFDAINECYDTNGTGGQNYKNYCNVPIEIQQHAGDNDLTASWNNHYLSVSRKLAANMYIFPLYARPNILIVHTSSGVGGFGDANNPTSIGPTWHMEFWTH